MLDFMRCRELNLSDFMHARQELYWFSHISCPSYLLPKETLHIGLGPQGTHKGLDFITCN